MLASVISCISSVSSCTAMCKLGFAWYSHARRPQPTGLACTTACMSAGICEGLHSHATTGHLHLEDMQGFLCSFCCNQGITAEMHTVHTLSTHSLPGACGAANSDDIAGANAQLTTGPTASTAPDGTRWQGMYVAWAGPSLLYGCKCMWQVQRL